MNTNKLRAKMALYGDTGNTLSEAIGLSPQRFSAKINDNNAQFMQGEIQIIKDRYNLTPKEVDEIFLSNKYLIKIHFNKKQKTNKFFYTSTEIYYK